MVSNLMQMSIAREIISKHTFFFGVFKFKLQKVIRIFEPSKNEHDVRITPCNYSLYSQYFSK